MADRICQNFDREYVDESTQQTASREFNFFLDSPEGDLNQVLARAEVVGLPPIGAQYSTGAQALTAVTRVPQIVRKEKEFYRIRVDYGTRDAYKNRWISAVTTRSKDYEPANVLTEIDDLTLPLRFQKFEGSTGAQGQIPKDKYIFPSQNLSTSGVQQPLNTARDAHDPSPKSKKFLTVITMKRVFTSMAVYNPPFILSLEDLLGWQGRMNDARIDIAGINGDRWSFLIEDIQTRQLQQADGTQNTEVQITVIYDIESHTQVPLNAGYNKLVDKPGGGKRRDGVNSGATKASQPMLLDKLGQPVPVDAVMDNEDGPPYFNVFNFYFEKGFDQLNLPTVWE